ncbi:hypothetical protein [Flavobacterium sp. SLB02]|uniref:hypothetical protein n=1 Tax=Flavobacterium sp. SLB02 TaxID=2665645 RepID=UPI0012A9FC9B|nr:hypothetical protein [Flavobacterium sp. SLB02]QGK75395.1 hypothetical protein GIY83_15335 [Flavobacterium sp. SLB02]
MKIPKSSQDLIEEIYICVDLSEKLGDLRIRQLYKILNKVSDEIIIQGVIQIFENKNRNNTLYLDQLYAGQILTQINPKSTIDLKLILDKTLDNWNKSISNLPYWLLNNYTKETLKNELLTISNHPLKSNEKDNAETMIWWIEQVK